MRVERTFMVISAISQNVMRSAWKPPDSLDSLVPAFVEFVPVDYMDGQPMKYHLNPDGSFVLTPLARMRTTMR